MRFVQTSVGPGIPTALSFFFRPSRSTFRLGWGPIVRRRWLDWTIARRFLRFKTRFVVD